eukprot:SAG11_NODE_103_length_16571_cov_49.569208_15_plen_382_part_00
MNPYAYRRSAELQSIAAADGGCDRPRLRHFWVTHAIPISISHRTAAIATPKMTAHRRCLGTTWFSTPSPPTLAFTNGHKLTLSVGTPSQNKTKNQTTKKPKTQKPKTNRIARDIHSSRHHPNIRLSSVPSTSAAIPASHNLGGGCPSPLVTPLSSCNHPPFFLRLSFAFATPTTCSTLALRSTKNVTSRFAGTLPPFFFPFFPPLPLRAAETTSRTRAVVRAGAAIPTWSAVGCSPGTATCSSDSGTGSPAVAVALRALRCAQRIRSSGGSASSSRAPAKIWTVRDYGPWQFGLGTHRPSWPAASLRADPVFPPCAAHATHSTLAFRQPQLQPHRGAGALLRPISPPPAATSHPHSHPLPSSPTSRLRAPASAARCVTSQS